MLVSVSPEQMPMTVQQPMNDESSWQIYVSAATRLQRYNWRTPRWHATCAAFCYEFQRRGEWMNTTIKTPGDDHDI